MNYFIMFLISLFFLPAFAQKYSPSSLRIVKNCQEMGFSASDLDYLVKNDKTFNINAYDENNVTALMWCAAHGRYDNVNDLLKHGAFVDAKDPHGQTALMISAKFGKEIVVWRLLKANANPKIKDIHGMTAADYANRSKYYKIVEMLGGKPQNLYDDKERKEAQEILNEAFEGKINRAEFERRFAKYGHLIDDPFKDGSTILHLSVLEKKGDLVEAALRLNANPDIQNESGVTPLMIAASPSVKNLYALKRLLEKGADPNFKNKDGKTALDFAESRAAFLMTDFLKGKQARDKKTQEEIVAYLKSPKKNSKFKQIVLNNKDKIAKMNKDLLKEEEKKARELAEKKMVSSNTGPKFNQPVRPVLSNEQRMRMIVYAFTVIDKNEIGEFANLLDRGLPVNARDGHGNPMILRICHYGFLPMLQMLVGRGADINIQGVNGQTALMEAVRNYRYDIVSYLVKLNANKAIRNRGGWTAHDFARQNRDRSLMIMTSF